MIITLNLLYRVIIGLLGIGMLCNAFKAKSLSGAISCGIVLFPLLLRAVGIK